MKDIEIQFYKRKIKKYRGTSMQVGYGSDYSQSIRFNAIIDMLENMCSESQLLNSKFLDFGCGKGDLLVALNDVNIGVEGSYIGIDAISENIEDAECNSTYINIPYRFEVLNWEGYNNLTDEVIDLVLFSGPFATTEKELTAKIFTKLLSIAKIGVIGTFLRFNSIVKKYEEGCILHQPEEILSLIDPAKFKICIKADYLPHDFTIGAIRW